MRHSEEQEALMRTLRLVAPGTSLYEGLENILRARTGALIVVGDSEEVMKIVNGGFRLNTELDPASLYELSKMDGALIISSDARRIVVANAHLTPDPLIPTSETGTRHRTAERAAAQTGELVIAISQRRNVITLYKGEQRYILREIGTMLAKANQALQTLERYKTVLQKALVNLTALEFEEQVTLADVCTVIQRAEMVTRIAAEIELYICELGTEGRLVSMQLEEVLTDIEDEDFLVLTGLRRFLRRTASGGDPGGAGPGGDRGLAGYRLRGADSGARRGDQPRNNGHHPWVQGPAQDSPPADPGHR